MPEGALSGYAEDPAFLHQVDIQRLRRSLEQLREETARREIHLIFGSCVFESGSWYNAGFYFGPHRELFIYHKVNLATHERGHFAAGSALSSVEVKIGERSVRLGIQLCREIRFPEQWRALALQGVEVFAFLTHAVGDSTQAPVWRSHLISRAAENQRFVFGVNNAGKGQKCPSMVVAPDGRVIWEVQSASTKINRCPIDLSEVSDWYLSQSRRDI